jgi:predicted kinase
MKPLTTSTPHVIIMVGIPGAGKTTFAEHFAKTFHAPYVHSSELEGLAGIDQRSASIVAAKLLSELLKTHHTIVFEGDTSSRTTRLALVKTIAQAGYKPLLVWVQTETVEAKRRSIRKRSGHAPLTPEQFDTALKRFAPPASAEKAVVISGKHTYATQVKIILKHLAGPRPEPGDDTKQRVRSGRNIIVR